MALIRTPRGVREEACGKGSDWEGQLEKGAAALHLERTGVGRGISPGGNMDINGSRISVQDDSDDDFAYEEVEVDIDDDDIDEGEDLETALIKVRQQQQVGKSQGKHFSLPSTPPSWARFLKRGGKERGARAGVRRRWV